MTKIALFSVLQFFTVFYSFLYLDPEDKPMSIREVLKTGEGTKEFKDNCD